MRRADYIFESYLVILNLPGFILWIADETSGLFYFAFAGLMLTLCQFAHTIIMQVTYPGNERLKQTLPIFWAFMPVSVFIPVFGPLIVGTLIGIKLWWFTRTEWKRYESEQQNTG